MKVARIRKDEEIKRENITEGYSLKNMVKILVWLVGIFGIFYCITILLINNKVSNEDSQPPVIDSSRIILSQILNRNEKEYFVIATKDSLYASSYIDANYVELYNNYINKYKQKEDAITFYYVDLDSALNKKYISENLNITDDIDKLELNDETLFKIKDGRIEKYYVGKEKILDKLSKL